MNTAARTIDHKRRLYKQEGRVGLYQVLLPYLTSTKLMEKYVSVSWGEGVAHGKANYFAAYFYEENLQRVADEVLSKAASGEVNEWLGVWKQLDSQLTDVAWTLANANLEVMPLAELRAHYDEVFILDQEMWRVSIFIDVFDAGFDQKEIERIAKASSLSTDEIHVLTTPKDATFLSVWEDALLQWKRGELAFEDLRKQFFWNGTTYSEFAEVDESFVQKSASIAHSQAGPVGNDPVMRILSARGLSENPLGFFRTITQWRDERKRLNYTGLYALLRILREVASRYGIDHKNLNVLLPHEIDGFFEGRISNEQLASRLQQDVVIWIMKDGTFEYVFGPDATDQWNHVQNGVDSDTSLNTDVRGTVASKGVVRGTARVIIDFTDPRAHTFAAGDVLITSMTRPEFLPLMKLAAAFVTNEGGITSHAAIVAREMKKPCIIGTKNATQVFKDGDMIEVDAERGIVRKV